MSTISMRSFHGLSVEHPRFAVHPLFWTANHLEIVNCSFHQVDDTTEHSKACHTPDKSRARYAERLASAKAPGLKGVFVTGLLIRDTSPLEFIQGFSEFEYGRQRYPLPECHIYGIAKNKCVHQPHPSIGYYRYDADQSRRFRLRPRRGPHGRNGPVKRLYARRLLQIQPSSWYNDPYLFSLVLSLAQVQRAREKTPCQEVYFARLLVTNQCDTTHAYVFKADIPRQLLECLQDPKRSLFDFRFPSIKYTKVSFTPYTDFSDRILSSLVTTDVVTRDPVPAAKPGL